MDQQSNTTIAGGRPSAAALHPLIREDILDVIARVGSLQRLGGKTILLTGAGGMIASYLAYTAAVLNESVLDEPCTLLAATRSEPRAYPRLAPLVGVQGVEFVRLDCAAGEGVPDRPIDYVIHAASLASPAQYLANPLDTVLANTDGLRVLLEAGRQNGCEGVLFVSSGQIYGSPPDEFVPTPEDYPGMTDPLDPRACYDQAKRLGETLCAIYAREYGLPVTIVRPMQIYGPGVSPADKRAFSEFTWFAAEGRPIVLRSEGKARRSYCYLSDAAAAMWTVLLDGVPGEAYNVGCSEPLMTIRQLAEMIASIADPPCEVIMQIDPADSYLTGAPEVTCPDVSKLAALRGAVAPRVSPEIGFARMLRWAKDALGEGART